MTFTVPSTAALYSRLAKISGVVMLPATRVTNEVPDALIEDELHRHARIGAGEHRRERHLLRRRLCAERREIVEGQFFRDRVALVAGLEFVEGLSGGHRFGNQSLRPSRARN